MIYWERPGGIKLENLRDSGVSMPALLRHNVFINEFVWNGLNKVGYCVAV